MSRKYLLWGPLPQEGLFLESPSLSWISIMNNERSSAHPISMAVEPMRPAVEVLLPVLTLELTPEQ